MFQIALRSAAALAGVIASPGATQLPAAPNDLNQFGLICFCNSRVATPHYSIGLDNNGRLLFHARNGVTREALAAAGVSFSESQLRMLQDWGMLRENSKILTTAFPVLEPVAMEALRDRLRPVANKLLTSLQPHARAIKQELARRDQTEATYATLFSYVLDGLVWDELRSSGKLPKMDITVEKPFWAGTFWAVYPKQEQMPGTNGRTQGRGELRMLWTPRVVEEINDFYGSSAAGAWIKALVEGVDLPPLYPDVRAKPVLVREETGDAIFAHGSAIANIVAPAMLATDLAPVLPQADESQRLLIGTHELIWMLLDGMVQAQKIAQPAVLTDGARSSSDLAPLVIGVLRRPDTPSPQ